MFTKATPLRFDAHRDLKVLETNDYSFARSEIVSPFVFDEMADIAREYPIVFPDNGSGMPAALLGLEAGHNAYIADDGRWFATYVPSHIRRYPFAFTVAPGETEPNRFTLIFDENAPHFHDPNGHPVFDANGQPSEHMKRRIALLEDMQRKLPATRKMVADIDAAGLLVERVIHIKRNGQENRVQGLRVVDEKKLNSLPHDQFAALRDKGVLPLIYAHLLSWANFRLGPLAGKYPDLAARPTTRNPDFLFENETINFGKIS